MAGSCYSIRSVKYNPNLHHRRSIRLPAHDYRSTGAYFVTICTDERLPLLGRIVGTDFAANKYGSIVQRQWLRSAEMRSEIQLDAFIMMPNHVHGIVWIAKATVGAQGLAPLPASRPGVLPGSLASMIRGFKSAAKIEINEFRRTPRAPVWQRNYYERVIRNDHELERAREYILDNPRRWAEDKHNPSN